MSTMGERLRAAREGAGFASAREGAARVGAVYDTYAQHENGTRDYPAKRAEIYARAFNVDVAWLLYGKGGPTKKPKVGDVPVVGYVGAGAAMNLFSDGQGPFDYVTPPTDRSDATVAAEIRGDSLGPFFDQWLVFYDDVQSPVSEALIGELCVCGLDDGRVLIKKLKKSRADGLFHLLSQTEDPILDVPVAWAAKVKELRPR